MNPDDLTPQEAVIMLGLIREGVRKARRTRSRGVRRWGKAYDASTVDKRLEILEHMYTLFGGDPKIINEREHDAAGL